MNKPEVKAQLEALLFMALEPISLQEFKEATSLRAEKIKAGLEAISEEYAAEDKGVELVETASGYQLQTKSNYQLLIKEFHQPDKNKSLSQAALETLAIIAYKQPVTKPEIEEIRGVNVEKALKTLQKRSLVEQVGQKDTLGCPKLYGTTEEFLDYLGLSSLEELPSPSEVGREEVAEEEIESRA